MASDSKPFSFIWTRAIGRDTIHINDYNKQLRLKEMSIWLKN